MDKYTKQDVLSAIKVLAEFNPSEEDIAWLGSGFVLAVADHLIVKNTALLEEFKLNKSQTSIMIFEKCTFEAGALMALNLLELHKDDLALMSDNGRIKVGEMVEFEPEMINSLINGVDRVRNPVYPSNSI